MLRSSDTQLGRLRPLDSRLVRLKLLLELATRPAELVNNLRATTNVQLRLHHVIKVRPDRLEEFRLPNPVNKVVGPSLVLDLVRSLEREDANLLMGTGFVSNEPSVWRWSALTPAWTRP